MFTFTKRTDWFRKNLPQGVIIILVVSLFILIHQGNVAHAQGNQYDTSEERADLPGKQNSENQSKARGYALFYRVIVENNLFRPLGWQMPRREPKYVLIATLLESHGKMAKALLMENASKQTYTNSEKSNLFYSINEKWKGSHFRDGSLTRLFQYRRYTGLQGF